MFENHGNWGMEYPKKLKAFEAWDGAVVKGGAIVVLLGVGVVLLGVVLLGVTVVPISLYLYLMIVLGLV